MRKEPRMPAVIELTKYFEASDANSRGTLFAGAGKEYGEGKIYRSEDRGETWREIFDIPVDHKPNAVRVCFVDSRDYIFIGALERLYRSKDDGKTWEPVFDFPPGSHEPWAVDEDPHGGIYVGSHGNNSRIFKTSDGGDAWEEVTGSWSSKHSHDIKCSHETGWVYAVLEHPQLRPGTTGRQGLNGRGALPGRLSRFLRRYLKQGSGTPGIWRSKDGGKTWTYIVRGGRYKIGFAVDGETCLIGTEHSGSTNRIYRFIDDGSEGPFKPTIVHTFPSSYGQPVTAGRVIRESADLRYVFSTGNTAGPTGTAHIVGSIDGFNWEIIDSKASVSPRRSFYFLSHHHRGGYIYACKHPRGIAIRI